MHSSPIFPMILIFTTILLGRPSSVYCPVNIDLGDNAGHTKALSVVCYLPTRFQRDGEFIELEAGRISKEDALRHLGHQRITEGAHEAGSSMGSEKKNNNQRSGEPSVENYVWVLDSELANCPICQDSFMLPTLVDNKWEFQLLYKCSQCKDKFYHLHCMNDWMNVKESCPCCRLSFEEKLQPQIEEFSRPQPPRSRPQPPQRYESPPRRRIVPRRRFCSACRQEWEEDEYDDDLQKCIHCIFFDRFLLQSDDEE